MVNYDPIFLQIGWLLMAIALVLIGVLSWLIRGHTNKAINARDGKEKETE